MMVSRLEDLIPQEYLDFCSRAEICLDAYADVPKYLNTGFPHRYACIRAQKNDFNNQETIIQIASQLNTQLTRVECLQSAYLMDGSVQLSRLSKQLQYFVLGIDITSMIVVDILDPQSNDNILDVSCAPGSKLIYADYLMNSGVPQSQGTLTGVDLSQHRLFICKSQMQKHNVKRFRLYNCSGTSFRVGAPLLNKDSQYQIEHSDVLDQKFCRPFYSSRMMNQYNTTTNELYDKVLVDVPCTHDGSFSHVIKSFKNGTIMDTIVDDNALSELQRVQFGLLQNGFDLLKRGGTLVYSTCSLSPLQNEDICLQFVLRNKSNLLVTAIPNRHKYPQPLSRSCIEYYKIRKIPSDLMQRLQVEGFAQNDIVDAYQMIQFHSLRYYGGYSLDANGSQLWTSAMYIICFKKL
ncbi:hypothetical protein MIR68_006659 [Amoeboaphelidium protococcarum]|nr:hypothetical protein MIR68_006659 [Amoeboaphelidium protococcarum]